MKRIIAIVMVSILVILNVNTAIPVSAAVDNSKYIPKIVTENGKNHLVFDPEIAKIAREMSSDTYGIKSGSKAKDIAKTFDNEDFVDIQQSTSYWYDALTSSFSNNFLVGVKTFEIDGSKKHVLAIAFRGTNDAIDIVTDLTYKDSNGYHDGFYAAAIEAYDSLYDMKFDSIKNEKGKSISFIEFLHQSILTDDYYVLVTGHSLGGAVANIFTGEILPNCGVTNSAVCYTFASPNTCSTSKAKQKDAYNIFNIINTEDVVPVVGYGITKGARLGIDLKSTVSSASLSVVDVVRDNLKLSSGNIVYMLDTISTYKDIIFDNHDINKSYNKVTTQVISNIGSMYKYTIPYYIKWKNGGSDNTTGSNGGGFRGENNTQEPVTPQGTTTNNSEQIERNKIIQIRLNYVIGAGLEVDGICGQHTVEAIKRFQRAYGLTVDGICGSVTWNKLEEAYNNRETVSQNQNEATTTAAISFSKSQLNLDYNSHPSETITITASGNLPNSYHLNFKFDSALSVTSGQWNGSSISTTIEMKGGPVKNNKIEVYLMDSSDKVYATNTIYVNATVPVIKQNTEIVLSTDNISIHFPDKKEEKMFVTIEGPILDNSTISIDTNESVTFEWGEWNNNRAELTIQSSRAIPENYTPSGYATIYIKDDNGNIYASKQFNLTSTVAKYAVRYDANGGYDAPDTHYIYHNNWDEKVSSHIPKREGYKFEGWSTSRNGKVEYGPSQQLMKDHDIVFYAVWDKEIDKNEWDLSISEDELFFEKNYETDKSVIISFYEPDGMQKNLDYHLRICIDDLTYSWGDEWYDGNGYKNIELIIHTPAKESYNEEVCIELIEENNNTVIDSESFYVCLTKKEAANEIFADRNKNGITVYVDGEKLNFDVQPRVINSRTMVPMRAIFEALGADVYWNGDTQTVYGETYDTSIEITIGEAYLLKNSEYVELDSPAVIIDGRTLVPVRAIAEGLNCKVEWYGETQTVEITSSDNSYLPEQIIADGEYVIATKLNSNYVLDIVNAETDNCVNLQLWEKSITPAQYFTVTYLGNGYYRIVNTYSGKALDSEWGGTEPGTNVWQYEINDTPAQIWKIEPAEDNSYYIINKESGLYLDVENAWADCGTNVGLFVRNDAYDAQKWYFIEK